MPLTLDHYLLCRIVAIGISKAIPNAKTSLKIKPRY
jgi:hypothetical protein